MKTILLLHDESESPKQRLQNGNKVTPRLSEGAPGCNCDRRGHPSPNCVIPSVFRSRLREANDLDCGRAWLREALHRPPG
jgi:hypothetical protein